MTLVLNGESIDIADGTTLSQLITSKGIEEKVMAAAVNMEIVKKEDWKTRVLKEGEKVELLQFVGGG
ncbi:MAG: sulfur carrier protein ThiS [Campylobacteraceae bacterium]|jgi:sulfur carrier protein|nr:sulfur carrier protein ThiS [Campylobacteraceae bacterium]